jgi:hypothetical protein
MLAAIAHDSDRDVFVVLGDEQTWEWTPVAGTWSNRTPAVHPRARTLHAMTFDPNRRVVLLFGGWAPGAALDDTWEWNGRTGTWTERQPAVRPPGSERHGLAYDPARGVAVVAGSGNIFTPSTWEWNGQDWMERPAPSPYGHTDLMYDPVGRRILLLNGVGSYTVWEWRPAEPSWRMLSAGCSPLQRGAAAATYDPDRGQVVLFGGGYNPGTMMYYDDLWTWTSALGWRGYATTGAWPPPRFDGRMIYDGPRQRVLMYGGANMTGNLVDLWELRW